MIPLKKATMMVDLDIMLSLYTMVGAALVIFKISWRVCGSQQTMNEATMKVHIRKERIDLEFNFRDAMLRLVLLLLLLLVMVMLLLVESAILVTWETKGCICIIILYNIIIIIFIIVYI